MPTTITIEVFGMAAVQRTLDAYIDAATDLTAAWGEVATLVAEMNRATFERGDAGGWAPLSPAYAAEKARTFPGRPILVRTGNLYDSLTTDFDVHEIGPLRMAVGTQLNQYGRYHQTGRPSRGLPKRSPVVFDEPSKRDVVRIVQRHLHEAARATTGVTTLIEGAA